jgi:hypothetical protein
LTLPKNTGAFLPGDIISITEKIDGANASIHYDKELDDLRCFSSRNELDFSNQLRGFLPYVQGWIKRRLRDIPIIFSLGNGWSATLSFMKRRITINGISSAFMTAKAPGGFRKVLSRILPKDMDSHMRGPIS